MIKLKQHCLTALQFILSTSAGIIVGLVVAGLVQYWRLASGVLGLLP